MLSDTRSHGLWKITAPPAPSTFALDRAVAADVVVIGAGYTGLSAALALAKSGVRVAVLEAAEIGFGGSGRNVGLVNAGLWLMPDDLPTILGSVRGNRLLDALADGPRLVFDLIAKHAIECEAVRNGTLHLGVGASGVAELTERALQWQKRGAPVELLDGEATRRKVGSSRFCGALLDRRAGTLQPLAYVRGLARAALGAGASIYTDSPATGYTRSGAGWNVQTPRGVVRADWVVVATNAYTSLGPGSPWPEIREEIVHLPYFNIATKPLSGDLARSILPERQGCWDTKTVLSSFRFDRAGRLVIGSVGALHGYGAGVHRRWARRSLMRLFPQLTDVEFEAEWYGKIGMTKDALPRFHQLGERLFSLSGYNGRGIAPGTVFGLLLARHILGQLGTDELPLPLTVSHPRRFRSIRERFYEIGSQFAHLSSW